jgi:hypothetical protein
MDGQTHMAKLTSAFYNRFANAPKNESQNKMWGYGLNLPGLGWI